MENLHEILGSKWFKLSCAVAGVVFGYVIVKRFTRREKKIAPKDTVILYQFGRGPKAPSISPFPLKLETYLRMANIPYENDLTGKMSSKGKTPWMEYNGVAVADSQFCIEYLNKERGIDLNAHLTAEQKAIARAFQKMTEENLYWCILLTYSYIDVSFIGLYVRWPLSWIARKIILRYFRKSSWSHGIGRHSKEQVEQIGADDLRAISAFLGDKAFFMGDQPCEIDCVLLGMLSQILWHMPDGLPLKTVMMVECINVCQYLERMKAKFWPDWEDCLLKSKRAINFYEELKHRI
ncbi:failed axon connections homolog isoform X2 [Lingula anatina]|uniref:Failed axon connections homolog isoform X2 n=1 Tax=Lingula anatina TaxID=7574 RepID=A0A1S3K956_LINAN|nr:failed axon connections homolog isoform X2 [Lingula anatina]|eukprot:XP_013418979.1 failed axon connections homolog isoform X2 [Lingula anatina]